MQVGRVYLREEHVRMDRPRLTDFGRVFSLAGYGDAPYCSAVETISAVERHGEAHPTSLVWTMS